MDFGLFVFLGFFAYSSLLISSRSDSLFVKLPILGLGVVAAAILGTFPIADEKIIIETTSISEQTFDQIQYHSDGSIAYTTSHNGTATDTNQIMKLEQQWSVLFFSMFHFLLAFLNGFNALYTIANKVNAKQSR